MDKFKARWANTPGLFKAAVVIAVLATLAHYFA